VASGNAEIVRRAWDAWIRGDVDGVLAVLDPEIEWDTTTFEGWPEAGVYKGHEGVREFLEAWRSSWDSFESGLEEIIDADTDVVVALAWQAGAGPGSRAPVRMEWGQVCHMRDGMVVRIEGWASHAGALESAGLPAA
jgi:ketosteroid isomerase-like protein